MYQRNASGNIRIEMRWGGKKPGLEKWQCLIIIGLTVRDDMVHGTVAGRTMTVQWCRGEGSGGAQDSFSVSRTITKCFHQRWHEDIGGIRAETHYIQCTHVWEQGIVGIHMHADCSTLMLYIKHMSAGREKLFPHLHSSTYASNFRCLNVFREILVMVIFVPHSSTVWAKRRRQMEDPLWTEQKKQTRSPAERQRTKINHMLILWSLFKWLLCFNSCGSYFCLYLCGKLRYIIFPFKM